MELKMPALIVLFGHKACALSDRLTTSLCDHLSPSSLRSVVLWRVDAGDSARGKPIFPQRELNRVNMSEDNYVETCFTLDYQALNDRQVENATFLSYCYLCMVTVGNEAASEDLSKVRESAERILKHWNKNLRSHLIWLTEDSLMKADENYRLLWNDLEEKRCELGGFNRITVLSGTQNNGASSYATRQERLDALAPCMLETANAATLAGMKVQTLAYRKFNCTSVEIRRLVEHRVLQKLTAWQAEPIGNIPLWELVTTADMPFTGTPDYDAPAMLKTLAGAICQSLPAPIDLLMLEKTGRMDNSAALVEDFIRNNQAELLEQLAGETWIERWMEEVRGKLRRCFALRTVQVFFKAQGILQNKLTAVAELSDAQSRALSGHSALLPGEGWLFNRKRMEARAYLYNANTCLEELSYLVLSERLRHMLKATDRLNAFIQDLLSASAHALASTRLTPEALGLYTAFAPTYDEAARAVIDQYSPDDRSILGESWLYYPPDADAMESVWKGYHQRMTDAVLLADTTLSNNFTSAYVRGKTPLQIEKDIRDKLSRCEWQLSGGAIGDTNAAAYYANGVLCDYFPQNQLEKYPLYRIPGDLVEYVRFGNVVDKLSELTQFPSFRKESTFTPNRSALEEPSAGNAGGAPDKTAGGNAADAANAAEATPGVNPWHIRLDRRENDFMLYWLWPDGHSEDAIIRIEHADGRQTTVPCNLDFYAREMGRAIPFDKLGVGRNRVSIYHEKLMQSVVVMGLRAKVLYAIEPGRRRRTIKLEDQRAELYPYTLCCRLEDESAMENLRLVLHTPEGKAIRYTLPEGNRNAEGVYAITFYTTAISVELGCTQSCADMLEIIRREAL